ncbi:MAG: MFS transporter, partial [Firmicutes bacterium]|nr:MFS transporter [Bacillota bacterium]
PLACILLVGAGFCMINLAALVNTSLQLSVPDRLRGRIMAAYFLVFAGVAPVGSLFSGGLARLLGAPGAFGVGALCGLAVVGLIALLRGAGVPPGEQARAEEGEEGGGQARVEGVGPGGPDQAPHQNHGRCQRDRRAPRRGRYPGPQGQRRKERHENGDAPQGHGQEGPAEDGGVEAGQGEAKGGRAHQENQHPGGQ